MPKTYTTISGDMFDLVALKTMGSEMYVDKLILANKQYRHIFIFPAGVVLTIPDVPIKSPHSLPPWKRGGAV